MLTHFSWVSEPKTPLLSKLPATEATIATKAHLNWSGMRSDYLRVGIV